MLMMTAPPNRGLFARQWRRLFPQPVNAYLDTVSGTPYIKILCEEHRRGIDWRMVEAHSLDTSGRLLLPAGMECPSQSCLRRFVPTRFIRRMLENFALETMLMRQTPPSKRSMAIYGSEAEMIALLPRLVPLVGELRIITRRAYAIQDIVEQTVRETGMTISVTDEPGAGDCELLLAPFGGAGFIKTQPESIVVSPDRPSGVNSAWISGVRVAVPAALEIAYSEQYDPLEFTGAFYELGAMRSLARLSPDYGCCGESDITSEQLAELMG